MARSADITARVAGMTDAQQDAFVQWCYDAEWRSRWDLETFWVIMFGDSPPQLLLPGAGPDSKKDPPRCP